MKVLQHTYPDPLKDPKNGPPPTPLNITQCYIGAARGIIRGFLLLDPLGDLGTPNKSCTLRILNMLRPQVTYGILCFRRRFGLGSD